MIYLWDEEVDFLLTSRYDPLRAGMGEAGMPRDDDDNDEDSLSAISSTPSSTRIKVTPSSSRRISKEATDRKKIRKDFKSVDGCINDSMMAIVSLLKTKNDDKRKLL